MKKSSREKFLFDCRNGATATRLKAIQEARHAFTQDLKQLEASGQQQCVDFTRNYEAATSQTTNGVMRPVRLRLKRYVVIPALVIMLLSLLVLIFSRGPLALLLLPLITWALGWLSVGCFGLSAGLGAYAYSLSWSKHAAKRFNATAKEASQTQQALDLINQMERELKPPQPPAKPLAHETALIVPISGNDHHTNQSAKAQIFNSLLVVIAAVWLAGCQSGSLTGLGSTTSGAGSSQPTMPTSLPSQLAIYVDWSLSNQDQPLQQASQNVVSALPEIAEKYQVTRVMAAHFGADGWDAEPIIAVSLPTLQLTAPDESEALLGVVRTEHEKQTRKTFHAELEKKLATLAPEMLLPINVAEPKCTDIQGVLNRITKTQQRQISIVITDGAENCASALQAVAVTQPLVIVLLSEKENQQSLAHESYEQRRQQLTAAAPRAVIVPHFDPQLLDAVTQAIAQVKIQQ